MADTGSSFTLCTITYCTITQQNTNSSMKMLKYGVKENFTNSFLSTSVLSTAYSSLDICHRKLVIYILIILNLLLGAIRHTLSSTVWTKLLDAVIKRLFVQLLVDQIIVQEVQNQSFRMFYVSIQIVYIYHYSSMHLIPLD